MIKRYGFVRRRTVADKRASIYTGAVNEAADDGAAYLWVEPSGDG